MGWTIDAGDVTVRRLDRLPGGPSRAAWLIDLETGPPPHASDLLALRPRAVGFRATSRAARHPAMRAARALGTELEAAGVAVDVVADLATGLRRMLFAARAGDRLCLLGHDAEGRARPILRFRRALLAGRTLPRHPFSRGTAALARRDAGFRHLVAAVGGVDGPLRPSTFETLARAVVYQQISGRAARAIWDRVLGLFDGRLDPDAVVRRRDATLRAAGLSAAKTAALKDLARHVASGRLDVEALPTLDDAAVVDAVTAVRGFGTWSAQMHLLFALGRPDVWPVGDLGIRKGLALFLGTHEVPDERAAETLGAPYAPWRSSLAWYLWRRTELGHATART